MNNFKVEVQVQGDPKFYSNGIRFTTEAEAMTYGTDLFQCWTAVEQWRVVEVPPEEANKL